MSHQRLHVLPLGPRDERRLAAELARGEPEAFTAVYQHFVGRVLGLARQLLRDRVAAEDATQETFLRFYRGFHRFRGDCALSTWLHRVAVNVCLDELARRKHRARPTDDGELPGVADAAPAPGIETSLGLREVLGRLEPKKQIAFYLCHVEGLTAAEIAVVLEEPLTSVQKRLQRTRRELLALWQGAAPAADAAAEGGEP